MKDGGEIPQIAMYTVKRTDRRVFIVSEWMPYVVTNLNGQNQMITIIDYEREKNRTIYITGEINDHMAQSVVAQLRYLQSKSEDDITLVINSPGGAVSSGFVILDAMENSKCDISTIGVGMVGSMAALLLADGTKGKRYVARNATVMIHQPMNHNIGGQVTDIRIQSDYLCYLKQKTAGLLARQCEQTIGKLERDMERDRYMTAEEAMKYGIADEIGFGALKL